MDRRALDELYAGVGSLAYDPRMLLKMVLYQYLKGRRSPAKWFEEAKLNEAMQWLGRGYTPARRTWYDFRDRIGGAIDRLHEQMIQTAIKDKLLDPTEAAQDGTSVAACASRHQMVNKELWTGESSCSTMSSTENIRLQSHCRCGCHPPRSDAVICSNACSVRKPF